MVLKCFNEERPTTYIQAFCSLTLAIVIASAPFSLHAPAALRLDAPARNQTNEYCDSPLPADLRRIACNGHHLTALIDGTMDRLPTGHVQAAALIIFNATHAIGSRVIKYYVIIEFPCDGSPGDDLMLVSPRTENDADVGSLQLQQDFINDWYTTLFLQDRLALSKAVCMIGGSNGS
jgi:hypothetical protein